MNNAFEQALKLRTNIARNWLEERSLGRHQRHQFVLECENHDQPWHSPRVPGVEVDDWMGHSPVATEVCTLMLPREDFAYADELHQRFFLILAAEVLYGPNHDARLQAEAIMMANEPA